VLVLGIDSTLEREQAGVHYFGFDGGDRTRIELPAVQEHLLQQVKAAAGNKPVVLVLTNGSALAVPWAAEHVPAILEAWYPGQRGGEAVADVLFGNYNPAGRLPVTFYRSTKDLPAFTDYSTTNRSYRYFTGPVLYPFGHGLSYSTFQYTGLTAPRSAQTGDDLQVSVTVKNSSAIAGDEVVECYVNRDLPKLDPATFPPGISMTPEQAVTAATPRKQLVGFLRVPLQPNEQKTVNFTITGQQLSVVNTAAKRVDNPEDITIQVGGTSAAGLTQPVTIQGATKPAVYKYVAPTVK